MNNYVDPDNFRESFEPVHITGLNDSFTNWSDFCLSEKIQKKKHYRDSDNL